MSTPKPAFPRPNCVGCSTTDEERGACIPPYFVVPLRLDGYPLSKTRDLDLREVLGG
jgi:hypothetical protein